MNLHEYQAKDLLRRYGIPMPQGAVAATAQEAVAVAQTLGGSLWVVKAQARAGGRGKAGGVQLVRNLAALRGAAARMRGRNLVTQETASEGLPVERVYVESGCDIEREIYLSLTLNRERGRSAVIASAAGGRVKSPALLGETMRELLQRSRAARPAPIERRTKPASAGKKSPARKKSRAPNKRPPTMPRRKQRQRP
jgi:acyl-CoA synthetase (NDP forming)